MDSRAGHFFPLRRYPAYGGFAYLAAPRLVLGVNAHLPRHASRAPTVLVRQSMYLLVLPFFHFLPILAPQKVYTANESVSH